MPQSGLLLYVIYVLYVVVHKINVARVYLYYYIHFAAIIKLTIYYLAMHFVAEVAIHVDVELHSMRVLENKSIWNPHVV